VTAADSKSQEVLREEILAEARRQADQIQRRGRADAEALLVKAKADAEKEHQDRVAHAQAAAVTLRELAVGRLPVDVSRMRSARIEALLESVRGEVGRRLAAREGFDYRESLVLLAAQAVAQMNGNRFVFHLSAEDRRLLGDGWLEDVRRRAGRPDLELSIAEEPARIQAGLIVRDADGRQLFDNSLQARLDRLWPAARREIAVRSGLIQVAGAGEEK
jgi:vacuolar-type H+-ATPase subunit E/Vma4